MDVQLDQLLRNRQWKEAADVYSILLRMQNNESKDRSIFCLLGRSECFLQLGDYEAVMEDCRSINDLLADFPYSESVRNRARSQLLRAILALEASTRDNEISRRQHEIGQDCENGTRQLDIVSNVGRNWIWRSPPRVSDADAYKLCKYWDAKQSCHFGLQCVEAHGVEELREWKQRYYCRQKRLQQAYEHEVIGKSYTEQLLEKLKINSNHLLSDIVDYVEDQCSSSLIATVYKSSQKEWIFKLLTNTQLRAVAFLNDVNRSCFSIRKVLLISEGIKTELVVRNNQEFINDNSSGLIVTGYEVTILFKTEVFGAFKQTVSFDFCRQPILAKDLCVEVIPEELVQKTNDLRNEIIFTISERWTYLNAEIIPFFTTVSSDHKQLFQLDAATDLSKFISGHDKELTVDNYKTYMHNLLYIEEIARNMQLSEYNIKSKLNIVKNYMLSSPNSMSTITKYSNGGELFALIQITQSLSEDTLGGRLILKNSNSVFLLVDQLHQEKIKPKVYEALIEDKCKNVIYLKLSSAMVKDLDLLPDTSVYAQLQFQLDRLSFCEWHQAVDKIPDIKLIFPDIYLERFIPWSPQRQWGDHVDSRLNPKQKEAIIAITTSSRVPLPPVLVIGPFGTGKTFTLAQALKILIKQDGTRILICTYSNSAADIYIKDYLHAYSNEGHHEARPLRIYYQKRWVTTVHPIVRQYCLIEEQGGAYAFRMPTIDEVRKHRIIVMTLSSSTYLSNLGLPQGYFTHILLDEAAQALECNAIIPLSLANRHTRIVLAGDHMQLSPEVISPFAKELGLHVSLLERLYYLYPSSFPCKILLSENYRAHEAIIDFTSDSFYEQKLIASGKQPKHPNRHPLTFFTAKGEDIQTINSTGFFNNSEVYEVVERVCGLKNTWPTCWGDFDERSIGVMTPYGDQVFRIRAELRKRRMGMVSVESVLNVQGKQFRAIFLSTVRTRKNCADNDGNTHDYGFLSNLKLLNTAITRAQSLVSVVGDPVALCTVGRCSKVWEKFIHICAQNNSLFGVTWQSLKNELDGLELKKLYGLNPLAPEFIPKHIPPTNCKMYAAVPLTYQPPMFNCNMQLSDAHPGIAVFVPNTCGPYVKNCGMQLNHPVVRPSRYFESSVAPRNVPPPIQMQHQQKNRPQFVPTETHVAPNISSTSNVMEELIGLLPNNLSFGAFLADPLLMQKQWIEYLGVTKGPEAAKKLEFFVKMAKGEETVNHPINPGMYPGNVVYTPFSQPNPVVRSDISLLN